MDMPRSAVAAGGALLFGVAGYLFYSKSSGTSAAPTPAPAAAVPATPAPTPIPTPEEPSPTPTPSVLEMLNQRFPATAAGRVQQTPAVVTTNPPPVAYSNPPAAPTATQAPPPTTDYRSTIDIERDKATSLLGPIMERMSASVRELTTLEGEFQKQCTGVMEMPYVDPYGNKIAGTMAKETTPECVSRKSRMTEIKTALPKDSAEVQDLARRNGILPGVVRDLVTKYQLGSYVR